MKLKIATLTNYVTPITMRKFLLLAKYKNKLGDDTEYCEVLVRNKMWDDALLTVDEKLSDYNLHYDTIQAEMLDKIIIGQAIQRATYFHTAAANFEEIIEEMAYRYVSEYGSPQYLVRVGPRQWMLSNVDDYVMCYTNTKISVVCSRPYRQFIYNIKKTT